MLGSTLYLGIVGSFLLLGAHTPSRAWIARQRWIRSTMAALAIGIALSLAIQGLQAPSRLALSLSVAAVLGGILLGPLAGRWLRLQEGLNHAFRWAASRLETYPSLSLSDATSVAIVLLALNPVGWLSAWLAGVAGDPLGMAWKATLDGITLHGLAAWRMRPAFGALLASTVVQGLAWLGGTACRPWIESQQLLGPTLLTASLVWLTLPILVLGIRKVSLAPWLIAIPAALALARVLQGTS